MGAVELSARAIEAFAWPLTVVVLLLVFRGAVRKILDQLSERIEYLRSLRGAGIEADFDSRVLEVREDARALGAPPKSDGQQQPVAPAPGTFDLSQIEDFDVENLALRAEQAPRDVIIESWLYLVESLRDAGRRLGIPHAEKMPVVRLLSRLSDTVDQWQFANAIPVIQDLRILRNDFVHKRGITLSPLAAHDYALTALQIALLVKDLPGRLPAQRDSGGQL